MITPLLSTLVLVACAPKEAPPAATAEEVPAAASGVPKTPEELVARMAALDFRDLVDPILRWDQIPSLATPADQAHQAVVVLVEFSDVRFDRFAGEEDQGDKLAAWYQELLFDDSYQRVDSLSHFYATQSGGAYRMDGTVLPPVRLAQTLAHYGAVIRPEGGDWRNDAATTELVEQALAAARATYPDASWDGFDAWDPRDADGDGVTDEPDGYVDHLVVVYAGFGQHACQRHYKLHELLNPNVGPEVLDTLSEEAIACANRLWPHRSEVTLREGEGPVVAGETHALGGVPLSEDLWVRDYNMQCEYTGAATFIHETGHSLGLPDVYARSASNSTGPWEVMSHTTSPSPQALSSWSRMQLGWLTPEVVLPPAHGGAVEASVSLGLLDAPGDARRAALVVLPPKTRQIDLVELGEDRGALALYSGQGNALERSVSVALALPDQDGLTLDFDAWWEIEAGWDFAYVEADAGSGWERLVPTDRAHMPAEHGHDGTDSLPGFTGRSGDLDGDGKNESQPDCDPTAEVLTGEDKVEAGANACEEASWVRVSFDLDRFRGAPVTLRIRYFTDGAAVEDGLLIDDLSVGELLEEDFEDPLASPWSSDGFQPSPGHHTVLVPHYYLLEYRDPYVQTDGRHDYDAALSEGSVGLAWDPESGSMIALESRPRPGVVAWYFDGAWPWSENDPAFNGPGHGYLLVVDANPNEIPLAGVTGYLQGDPEAFDTHYDVSGDEAQVALREAFFRTMCFVRDPAMVSAGIDEEAMAAWCDDARAAVGRIPVHGRPARYAKEIQDLLPGEEREKWEPVEELFDYRTRGETTTYRLRDRSLRHRHTFDAPFATQPFEGGHVLHRVEGDALVEVERTSHPAIATFSDADAARWLNPNLPFGGLAVPQVGLSWTVSEPPADAPVGTRAVVTFSWTVEE